MNRREILKKSTLAAIGFGLAPGILLSLQSCSRERPTSNLPIFLSLEQFDTVWEMAELVIPKTNSPGADDAGVTPFIDLLYGEYFEDQDKTRFETGLTLFIADCKDIYGKSFLDIDKAARIDYLQDLDKEDSYESFFFFIKTIILWAYFTSEPGMKSMNYLPVPGKYNGCITIDDQEKTLVGNR
jgi:hypothetical protein